MKLEFTDSLLVFGQSSIKLFSLFLFNLVHIPLTLSRAPLFSFSYSIPLFSLPHSLFSIHCAISSPVYYAGFNPVSSLPYSPCSLSLFFPFPPLPILPCSLCHGLNCTTLFTMPWSPLYSLVQCAMVSSVLSCSLCHGLTCTTLFTVP